MSDLEVPALELVRNSFLHVDWRDTANENEELDADVLGVMEVRFSPFNTWYRIDSFWEGSFMERTAPGAFKRTIRQHRDKNSSHNIKTLFNHGYDMHIGDKLLGDIADIREEEDGPVSVVNLWDTSYNRDLLPGLRRGSYGSSFMFRVEKDAWVDNPGASEHNPDGLPERTIKETSVLENGPVTWPASPTASAGMRCVSGTDAYYEHLERRDPERVERLRSTFTALRNSGRLAPGARLGTALATEPPNDSASRRSDGLAHAHQRRRYLDMLTKGNA